MKKIKYFIIIILILAIISGSIIFFNIKVKPIIVLMSEATIQNYLVNAINSAANMVIDETLKYEDMVNIIYDKEGNIQLIQANTVKINRLARDIENLAQVNVEEIEEQNITLPIGVFTGSILFSSYGPPFKIKLLPIGTVLCNFVSCFDSVGVNQTKHSIYIIVNSEISLVLPISTIPVKMETSVLVCESIIVGKVPEVYITDGSTNNMDYLNLVPGRN